MLKNVKSPTQSVELFLFVTPTGLSFKASVIIFEKNGYLVYPDVAIKKPITISEETLNEFEEILDYMLCEGYERMRQWKKEKEKQNSSLPF